MGYQYIDSIGRSNVGKYGSHGLLVSFTYMFDSAIQLALIETAPTSIIEYIPPKEVITLKTPLKSQTFPQETAYGLFGFDSVEPNQKFVYQLT